MAWTQPLPSGNHRGLYRDADGKTRSAGTFKLKRQALAKAEALEGEERREALTVAEWVPRWQALRRVEASTRLNDDRRLAQQLLPRWGDVLLADVKHNDVQAWVNELSDRYKPSSVLKFHHQLSNIMKVAVTQGLVDSNPCAGIRLPKIVEALPKYIPEPDLARMLDVLTGRYRQFAVLIVDTGLRWGELTGLHWQSVKNDHLLVEYAYDSENQLMKPPKSYAQRAVPLTRRVANMLNELDRGATIPAVPYVGCDEPMSGLVFPGRGGEPLARGDFAKELKAAARAVGYTGQASPHVLRHTYGSRLVQNGVDLYQVQRLMGHATLTMAAHYARLSDTHWSGVRKALGD